MSNDSFTKHNDLISLVNAFNGGQVLLVGDLILDRYVYGDAERISPEAPVPILRAVDRQDRVGGTANVAACLRALGSGVTCFGAVGDDANGRRLLALMAEGGVDCSGCQVSEDRQTTTKTRFVGLAQHRHRQQLLRLDEESCDPLPEAKMNDLERSISDAAIKADVICVEDYRKGVITPQLLRSILEIGRSTKLPVIIDPAIGDFSCYAGATAITPNRTELEMAAGIRFPSAESVLESIGELVKRWNVEYLAVTLDREGAVLAGMNQEPIHLPTRPRSVYDNTGAGDAVLATLAAAIAVGGSWENAVRLANVAGGLEVERFGCVPILAEEIVADLRLEQGRQRRGAISLDDLLAEIGLRRDRGETIVFTNGVFDVLHPGHVTYLAEARQLGSVLVVGLNSDASVKLLCKGDDRPVHDQRFRATMLSALESVDYVVIFDEQDPSGMIERVRPDVLVKGGDWSEKGVVGREIVERSGGRVCLIPYVDGYSTTSILERIRNGRS